MSRQQEPSLRLRWLFTIVAVAALAAGAFFARGLFPASPASTSSTRSQTLYQCPMHPQIVSAEPGTCPICEMKLQRIDEPTTPAAPSPQVAGGTASDPGKILFYRHPMRADIVSSTPAKDEMGMDYIPVREGDLARGEGIVAGHAPFTLSTDRQQLIGVTRARLEQRELEAEIRTVGTVAYDPALYQALVEYREALNTKRELKDSPWPEAQDGADAIVRSALLKLRQQGLSEQQARQMADARTDATSLLLPGKHVWVYAQVYEYESPLVRPGQTITVTAPSLPGATYSAKIAAVDSVLNATTRSLRIRAQIATPDEALRPEAFVNVTIQVPLGRVLAVPEPAVLHTGAHQFVFVVKGQGEFEPRAVTLGREAPGYYEVLSGLAEGEEVVTSANFLIDSESRFRAALSAFSANAAHSTEGAQP